MPERRIGNLLDCMRRELAGIVADAGKRPSHDPAAFAALASILERYAAEMSALQASTEDDVLNLFRTAVRRLNRLNAEHGGSLLETDEREVIVPFIIDCARSCGLDTAKFEAGDPTFHFREF